MSLQTYLESLQPIGELQYPELKVGIVQVSLFTTFTESSLIVEESTVVQPIQEDAIWEEDAGKGLQITEDLAEEEKKSKQVKSCWSLTTWLTRLGRHISMEMIL